MHAHGEDARGLRQPGRGMKGAKGLREPERVGRGACLFFQHEQTEQYV